MILAFLLALNVAWAHDSTVTVIETSPALEARFSELASAFSSSGTEAVADAIQDDLRDPERLEQWRAFVKDGQVKVVDVEIHPNEAEAVAWMNHRFERMGIPNLKLNGLEIATAVDPTEIDAAGIRGKKWLRYSAGPGVAAAAFFLNLPAAGAGSSEYLYLIIPTAAAGVTTVALEMQFAWPWLNNVFWKKLWTMGGAVGGRVTNIFVNFLYGMSIFGATRGGEAIAAMLGSTAPSSLSFTQAVVSAAIGAVTFHLAMGQYQTDIAREEARGTLSANQRYGLETTGVLVNNSARVASWVLPGGSAYGSIAQAGFFLWKTFPQLLRTNLSERLVDRQTAARLDDEAEPLPPMLDKCVSFLSRSRLLPRLRK